MRKTGIVKFRFMTQVFQADIQHPPHDDDRLSVNTGSVHRFDQPAQRSIHNLFFRLAGPIDDGP